ncbi:pyridine nucleotide-disulfide oxidoreductase [Photobacterium proteolyticum]|uniref:Pyridine nucleotide-disulfide oxidoreductase n=1 Tax=Photobacterium proteolyticum TaxID=1903952 RepID=A0A1Q9GLP7_9GAMM|nr:NAD(P)/FAD-dependent oxidoreductase [Photobacterium proteolyticum]OLQ75473.1 pyridine nucleotide-disulfide oxidoreductase [Photobacterium proteolyticum]
MFNVDVCIIGAGPAGMAAAIDCAKAGASVVLLDEQARPGGQIYRAIKADGHPLGDVFGPDYLRGASLVETLGSAKIQHVTEATIWRVDPDKTVYWSRRGKAEQLKARRIILATGALERSFPFPGWTLPGVMTAGASQILLKTAGIAPKQAVMVGTGPLLYLLAVQLINAGAKPAAIIDTQSPKQYLHASRFAINALKGHKYLTKGLKLLGQIRKAGVAHYTQATDICAHGNGDGQGSSADKVEQLSFRSGGKTITLPAATVLSHIGVIPNVQLSRAMGLEHDWDHVQRCWRPQLDAHNNTSLDGVAIAGDSGGIGGALVAEYQGQLVAAEALYALGYLDEAHWQQQTQALTQSIKQEIAIRPFLDTLYVPPQQALTPSDNTIVCRCEEVTAGEIRHHAREKCNGINQIKTYTRCGMGPCQGRYCGPTVAEIIADETRTDIAKVGYYRIRHPIKPLKLGELASLTPVSESFIQRYRANQGGSSPAKTTQAATQATDQAETQSSIHTTNQNKESKHDSHQKAVHQPANE